MPNFKCAKKYIDTTLQFYSFELNSGQVQDASGSVGILISK
jgi:hypothetical protein